MFKANHLVSRKGCYYFFIRVPQDLQQYIPSPHIKKSLKTKIEAEAKEQAIPLEYKVLRAFRLIRAGMLTDDQITGLICDLFPSKMKERRPKKLLLSCIVNKYVVSHEATWTIKTKQEVAGSFKLILDVMGDIEVVLISKKVINDFKSTVRRNWSLKCQQLSFVDTLELIGPSRTVLHIFVVGLRHSRTTRPSWSKQQHRHRKPATSYSTGKREGKTM